MEYSPILSEGFRTISLDELDSLFFDPFAENEWRGHLLQQVKKIINHVIQFGIETEIWIDGSFTTWKPEPGDVDMVFIFDEQEVSALPGDKLVLFSQLIVNRDKSKTRYSCDIHYFDKKDEERRAYYLNLFGTDRSQLNKKGIFKILIPGAGS